MPKLEQIICPNPECESIKSWKRIYANSETDATNALGQKHSIRCQECGTEFTFTPALETTIKRRSWGRFDIPFTEVQEEAIVIENMK